jgi:hypothetical protein
MYRILANSLPKNGTHLLLKCLGEIPGYEFSGHEVDWSDPALALRTLESIQPGEFAKGHIPCFDQARDFVRNHNLLVFNMIRDPRDNVISLVNYLMKHKHHPLHPYYARLASDEARILATIIGFGDEQGEPVIRDIGWRLNNWVGWDKEARVTNLRFEHLIGPKGGGDRAAQLGEINKILHDLGITADQLAETIAEKAFDTGVHSFRQGRIHGWKDVFTDEHKSAFKSAANWALVHYGYETDDRW